MGSDSRRYNIIITYLSCFFNIFVRIIYHISLILDIFTPKVLWLKNKTGVLPKGEPETYLLGEADGDGLVTIKDATSIQRYLASMTDGEQIDLDAADVTSDGVDINDVTQIQRYLAGFSVPYPINKVCGSV